MDKQITQEDIGRYHELYLETKENEQLCQKIRQVGIENACMNQELADTMKNDFSIEIPQEKIYNQHNTMECNIYAFYRFLKSVIRKSHPEVGELDLSATYLDFYDKLEKIHTCYQQLSTCENLDLETINQTVNQYIGCYGTFHYCKNLLHKYGMVPITSMPEVSEQYQAGLMIELLKRKVKSDALVFIHPVENVEVVLDKLMAEAYQFLAKILGNPPLKFSFQGREYSPLEFRDSYVPTTLDEFVTVTSYEKEVLKSSQSYIPTVYLDDNEELVTLEVEQIKAAVLQQLKDGVAVWFSAEESTTLNYDKGILDHRIYPYDEVFHIPKLSKEERLALEFVNYDHAMCIIGVLVEDGTIKQYKVDNSFGSYGNYQGTLVMSDDFFRNEIITLILDKKYL